MSNSNGSCVRNLKDAYREYNRQQQAKTRYLRELRRISARIDDLQESMLADIAAQRLRHEEKLVEEYTKSLMNDVAFNRVLSHYTGRTAYGWEIACGCDGRMKSLLRNPGWRVLSEVIDRIKARKGMTGPSTIKPMEPVELHIVEGVGKTRGR